MSTNESGPCGILLARLEGVKRSGKGWLAKCPAHQDRSASLTVAEGRDGRALLRCFAGCETASVLRAIGLEMADLFPARASDQSPEGRAAARQAWRESGWQAALNVLGREAAIVSIAGEQLAEGRALSADDQARLRLALERIESCREVLA
jgi:hypothetical protein